MLFFIKAGIKIRSADFGKKTMMGSFLAENFFKSVVSMIVHDGFTTSVIGFFGFQEKLPQFVGGNIFQIELIESDHKNNYKSSIFRL